MGQQEKILFQQHFRSMTQYSLVLGIPVTMFKIDIPAQH